MSESRWGKHTYGDREYYYDGTGNVIARQLGGTFEAKRKGSDEKRIFDTLRESVEYLRSDCEVHVVVFAQNHGTEVRDD